MKVNKKPMDHRVDTSARLAGGYGPYAAKQDAEALLRRAVLACLLWEDLYYESGASNAENIRALIPQVAPETVAEIAIEAREKQKLRHVPLFIVREMARLDTHKHLVGKLLPKIIHRADELAEFLAIYWKDGKQPLSKQVKIGLAKAFQKFDAYQLAKYNRDEQIKLRDVLFMVHSKPKDSQENAKKIPALIKKGYKRGEVLRHGNSIYTKLITDTLPTPDTWEVALSAGADKKETWSRLIKEKKLGALAFIRNLRNMEEAGVERSIIQLGFDTINPKWLLPLNYLAAAKAEPKWEREIEALMLKGLSQSPKLKGHTIFVVDVSGSMSSKISEKSDFSRLDVASAMALLASEVCEHISIYATAGNDGTRVHATKLLPPRRGFALCDEIKKASWELGGGGIFTRQCLEFIKSRETEQPDRIIIFSDSQDCDWPDKRIPKPFGKRNYIVDVSAHKHGINYDGIWTAEVSGWSEYFLVYIAALEGLEVAEKEENMNE